MRIVPPIVIADAMLTSSVPETDYDEWSDSVTYVVGDRRILPSTHRIYESLRASNLNHNPATDTTDPPYWQDIGPTNCWAMFDNKVGTQTSAADSIVVTLDDLGQVANNLTIFNASAATVRLEIVDPVDGDVFDETVNLVSDSGISDWYDWFFAPIVRRTSITFDDLPPYSSASYTLTLTDTGATVAIGSAVIGYGREYGGPPRYGARTGIRDFSIKDTDVYGNYELQERAFSRRQAIDVLVDAEDVDEFINALAAQRATPTVYISSSVYECLMTLGFYRDFDNVIAFPEYSILSIDIESLA